MAAVNLSSTLPIIFENTNNFDASIFLDIANIWELIMINIDDSNKIRSSVGIGVDWLTIVGPKFIFYKNISNQILILPSHLDLIWNNILMFFLLIHYNYFFFILAFSVIRTKLKIS